MHLPSMCCLNRCPIATKSYNMTAIMIGKSYSIAVILLCGKNEIINLEVMAQPPTKQNYSE